jgi:YhcH/YjgK/YiaL family protein
MIICPWSDISRYESVIPGLAEAIETVKSIDSLEPATYPLPGCGGRILVQKNTTKPAEGGLLEAHKNFLDIQYIVEGGETMGWAPLNTLTEAKAYNPDKDVWHFDGERDFMFVRPGYCYVVYPEDAHQPGVHIETPNDYVKMVIKLPV